MKYYSPKSILTQSSFQVGQKQFQDLTINNMAKSTFLRLVN